jgi:methionyl-tRNA formyltransferase
MTSITLFGSMGVAVECLEWLLGKPEIEVRGVVCSRDPVSAWRAAIGDRNMAGVAPALGVPMFDLDDAPPADLGLSVRFHQILRRRHLDRYRLGVVNLHGAPLPEMRGSFWEALAIIEGRLEYGASLHFIDEGIDSGPILAVERFPVLPADRGFDLLRRANETGLALIKRHLDDIVSGTLGAVPQGPGRALRAAEVLALKSMPRSLGASEVERRRRAFDLPGSPPAFFENEEARDP